MKSYCKNCETIQGASFRPCTDVVTGASYEDLCCDSCHYIVATIEERKALAQRPWVDLTDEEIGELIIGTLSADTNPAQTRPRDIKFARSVLAKFKEKNNG